MLIALTRAVSPTMGLCQLSYIARQEIDIEKAIEQHHRYESCLAEMGARIVSVPPEPDMPDAVFVEDPVVVVDEVAVIAVMGSEIRRKEADSLAKALSAFRPLRHLREPANLEGGDVMRVGSTVFVGLSQRTNEAGVSQLTAELAPFGYQVKPVAVHGCLHLKSAVCYLGDGAVLANRAWLGTAPLDGLRIIEVADDEPSAANVLRIGDTVLMPASYPHTEKIIRGIGLKVQTLDMSEIIKAEGGMTCTSVIFESGAPGLDLPGRDVKVRGRS
jgi:dimethylargininase